MPSVREYQKIMSMPICGEISLRQMEMRTGQVERFGCKKMTPAQIADAQKLARECVHKKYKGC